MQQVRDLFLEREYKQSPGDYYLEDIKLIENMDFLLQRYIIMQRKNVDASVKMVSQMLKWRKERKLYEMKDEQFLQEFTLSGAAFLYEPDKFGNRTVYLRASMVKNCNEVKQAMKDFLTYLVFQVDDSKDGTPFSVIMDLTNVTWNNYDLDLLMHFVAQLKDYFPVNLDYVLAINFPWLLSTAWTLIKRSLPTEKRGVVQFISSDKVFEYIDKDNVPDFLGGACKRPYSYVNEDAPNAIEYLVLHVGPNSAKPVTKKRLREILNTFSDILPKEFTRQLQQQIDQLPEGDKLAECLMSKKMINNNNNNIDEVDVSKKQIQQPLDQEAANIVN